jgi:serine/threonine-protein kinase
MSLSSGTRLGPYEIAGQLGAGGMGEVYKARDTRLERTVAIKVLSPDLARDEAFRARFDREAKSISQLSHPHICALHDVGHHDEVHFLVLEYLQGETLATRIARGAMPVDQAIKIAVEICGALDNAHRHGVTHRDLKPGNVMLTKTGSKLLDFGLAKSSPAGADGMTMAAPITAQGSILGTFQYMAPEQLDGQEADPRSDIWALGCTVYEMVTGRAAFAGKTQASLIGAILKDEPARMSAVQPLAPAALDRVVMACLAKDPDERWQSAADIARELTWVATAPSGPAPQAVASTMGRRRERLTWMAAMAVVLTLAGVGLWRSRTPPVSDSGSVVRANLPLVKALAVGSAGHPAVAVSPDGRHIAYCAGTAGTPAQLYVRNMDEAESRAIDGTVGASYPFFSPNSASLGFLLNRSVNRIALGGGAPVPMLADLDITTVRGVAWGDDDWIYYTPNYSAGLWRVRASGGDPEPLTTLAQGEKTHRFPFVLPGSRAVLFEVGTSKITSFDDARIEVLTLATRTRQPLVPGGTYPLYVSTGHLLYTRAGKLIAVPFDRERLTLNGASETVADGMFVDTPSGSGNHGVSRDGTLVRQVGGVAAMPQTLLAVDLHGPERPVRAEPGLFPTVGASAVGRLSRSAKNLAIYTLGATSQIAVLDLERGTSTLLTDEWDNINPVWVLDESRIVFSSNRGSGANNLWWQRSDGSGEAERLTTSNHRQAAYSWSPGARVLAYTDIDPNSGSDIWTLSIDDRKTQPLVRTSAEETAPAFSPDGHWIAYHSDKDRPDRPDVYVRAFPSGGVAQQVSNGGGTQPVWRGDHEIVYRRGQSVMSVQIATAPTLRPGEPVELFRTPNNLIDVMPDGRLLMLTATLAPPVTELEIVVNWFQDLRKKMAGGR